MNEISLENIDNALSLLAKIHQPDENCSSFSVFGSYARNRLKVPRDVDCIVLVERIPNPLSVRQVISSQSGFDFVGMSDDSYRYRCQSIEYGIVYRLENKFLGEIEDITAGKRFPLEISKPLWAIGGNIPEVIIGDIAESIILFDKDKKLTELKAELQSKYPKKLRDTLLKMLGEEISLKLDISEKLCLEKNYLAADVGIADLVIALSRYLFAKNEVYIPSIKHIRTHLMSRQSKISHQRLEKFVQILENGSSEEKLICIKKMFKENER
ncbi:MAG: DUF4037 domain-containing protein [Patescibacteria group bacterium]